MAELKVNIAEQNWLVNIPDHKLLATLGQPKVAVSQSAKELVVASLESPVGFEPLRRALTPDDRITLCVDTKLPCLPELLSGILEHLQSANIDLKNVTLLLAPPARNQGFIDDLPDELSDVRVEIHDPNDEKKHAYLASTQTGRRVYLNRTLQESDFVIVLSGRHFDPVYGITGGLHYLYPTFSNAATLNEFVGRLPVEKALDAKMGQADAEEIAWLVGTPFFVQVVAASENQIAKVSSGLVNSLSSSQADYVATWQEKCTKQANLVIVNAAGEMEDLANALGNAAKVVSNKGEIVLLAELPKFMDDAFLAIQKCIDQLKAAELLRKEKFEGATGALLWSLASKLAHLSVGPDWPKKLAVELFATAVSSQEELQQKINDAKSVIIINNAQLALITV